MKPTSNGTAMGQMLECSPDLGSVPPPGQEQDSLLYYVMRSRHLGGRFLSCHEPRVTGGVPGGTNGLWATHWKTSVTSPFFSEPRAAYESALRAWLSGPTP